MSELNEEIKIRVSKHTKETLTQIAEDRGEGVNVSDVVREAIAGLLRVKEAAGNYGSKKPKKKR